VTEWLGGHLASSQGQPTTAENKAGFTSKDEMLL